MTTDTVRDVLSCADMLHVRRCRPRALAALVELYGRLHSPRLALSVMLVFARWPQSAMESGSHSHPRLGGRDQSHKLYATSWGAVERCCCACRGMQLF